MSLCGKHFNVGDPVDFLTDTTKMPPDNQQRHVALIIETSNEYARGLLRGIKVYIREHRPWSICLGEFSRNNMDLSWLYEWKGHGIIARIENEQIAKYILKANLPTVDLSATRIIPSLPCIETNDETIARLASGHLLERGFKHFAYCGNSHFNWSNLRQNYFIQCINKAGFTCQFFDANKQNILTQRTSERERMINWLKNLPKPIGIMACYDILGQQVLEACRISGIMVPDEVAVIGVDNDDLICELSDPPLSSIAPNSLKTGYQAAGLLERLMTGGSVEAVMHLVEPIGIHTRMSTEVLAIEDKLVSEAVRFIRNHEYVNIQVNDLIKGFHISRRNLDHRFLKALGHTPHQEIINVKIKLINRFLQETGKSVV